MDTISSLVLFLMISTGGIVCAAFYGRKYEEALPLTCFVIIAVLYFFGIFGFLKTGVYFICSVCIILYALSAYFVIKHNNILCFSKKIFTPAFAIFAVLFIILNICNQGRLASSWDEFSHWADIVKAMYGINDYGTNPLSNSAFGSYPPAMALFQYFTLVLRDIVTGNHVFTEWRMYSAFQTLFLSLFMPFLKFIEFKNPIKIIISAIVVYCIPMFFYASVYSSIYIDPFLGMLAGFGMVTIIVDRQKTGLEVMTIIFCGFTLVLTKDAGLLFAVFLVAAYILDQFSQHNIIQEFSGNSKIKLVLSLITLPLAIAVARLTWSYNIKSNGASVTFSNKINFAEFFQIITTTYSGYRNDVLVAFNSSFFTKTEMLGNSSISLSYCVLFVILVSLIYFIANRMMDVDPSDAQRLKRIFWLLTFESIVYIFGLCVSYMFKFTEYEATRLASYERYMGTIFLMLWTVIVVAIIRLSSGRAARGNRLNVFLLCIILLVTPMSEVYSFLHKSTVKSSIETRNKYNDCAKMASYLIGDKEAKIYFISQQTTGYDYWVMRYSLRPYTFSENFSWSIGKSFYDGDMWTRTIAADEWQKELLNSYDYVLLYKLNDYFIEKFSCLFSNPNLVREKLLYKVNKDTGLLEPPEMMGMSSWAYEITSSTEWLRYADLTPYFDTYGLLTYFISFDLKAKKNGDIMVYMQNGSGSRYSFSATVSATTEYNHHTILVTPHYLDLHVKESWLAFYGTYGTGVIPSVKNVTLAISKSWSGEIGQ